MLLSAWAVARRAAAVSRPLGGACGVRALSSRAAMIPGVRRPLADVVHLDRLEPEPPTAVRAIWEAHHTEAAYVAGAAVDAAEHALLSERGAESPFFIFPVHREGGHFTLVSQFAPEKQMFVMTYLEHYKKDPALAPPWASVTLYDELLHTKQLGLLRAEADADRLTKPEAARLLTQLRHVYATDAYGSRTTGPWALNHAERHFNVEEYFQSAKPPPAAAAEPTAGSRD